MITDRWHGLSPNSLPWIAKNRSNSRTSNQTRRANEAEHLLQGDAILVNVHHNLRQPECVTTPQKRFVEQFPRRPRLERCLGHSSVIRREAIWRTDVPRRSACCTSRTLRQDPVGFGSPGPVLGVDLELVLIFKAHRSVVGVGGLADRSRMCRRRAHR